MKLPSLRNIFESARAVIARFPFVILSAIMVTFATIVMIELEGKGDLTLYGRILFAGFLGLPLFTGIKLLTEKKQLGMAVTVGLHVIVSVILLVYAVSLKSSDNYVSHLDIYRFFILLAAAHLFVSFALFGGKNETIGFWNLNRTFLGSIIVAAGYSTVLLIGFEAALTSIHFLFNLAVDQKRYFELSVIISILFSTLIFLNGLPKELTIVDTEWRYPKSDKVFAQNILLPIIGLYWAILSAYTVKILINWSLPVGWVSNLFIAFVAGGIFTLLFLYPLKDNEENRWISLIWRWFFISLIPLIILYILAISVRTGQYGITENRYLLWIVAIWITGITIYFSLKKNPDIKNIPRTLCLAAVMISFGPWGMFSVSERSQISRLEKILVRDSVLINERIAEVHKAVPQDDAAQIRSIITYLYGLHGYDGIRSWFSVDLKKEDGGKKIYDKDPYSVAEMLGVEREGGTERAEKPYVPVKTVSYYAPDDAGMGIKGYNHCIIIRSAYADESKQFPEQGISFSRPKSNDRFIFYMVRDKKIMDSIVVEMHPWMDKLVSHYGTPEYNRVRVDEMTIEKESSSAKMKIFVQSFEFSSGTDTMIPRKFLLTVFIKER